MNKNLLIVGAVAVAGFTLTAFYGPTKADQMADIATKVTAGLEALRADEKAKCDAKVAEAVATKVAEMSAAPVEPTPTVAPTPTKGTKKGTAKGPKAPTVPTPPPPPTKPVDVKTRGGASQEGAGEVKSRGGAVPEGKQEVKKRGGAVKVEGGGGK
jgi:outer membrane murein-binding lipoprotein Lpp